MFRPSIAKLVLPMLLIALAVIPILELRLIVFGALGLPFAYTTGLPFPYSDKPFYVSPRGAVAIALFWAIIVYVLASVVRHLRGGTRKA